MRIGIEGKVLTLKIGGIGRYAINLVKALLSISTKELPEMEFVIFTAPQTDRSVLDGFGTVSCDRFRGIKSTLLRSSFFLSAGLVLEQIDIFHGLDQAGIPFFFKKGKCVVTFHDVIALVLPETFPLKYRLVFQVGFSAIRRQADMVIVPSESAREDVVRYLKVDQGRIVIIPYGCEERFRPVGDPERFEAVRRKYGLPERYVLFVGVLQPRKNVATLLRAFSLLVVEKLGQDLKLVVAGESGWGLTEIRKMVGSLGLQDHVVFAGSIEDEDLPDLYRGAHLFVYPSLYEGFGLPILEAMACGIPVITSNISSMPEVAGDAAVLVDPRDPEGLASAMASVLTDEALREKLRQKGIARARGFSWDAVARKTLEVYTSLGGPKTWS